MTDARPRGAQPSDTPEEGLRDYVDWHRAYDDPASDLSRRLACVQGEVAAFLDETAPRPVRVLSACAGDGRDVLSVLAGRADRERVSGVLVELHPQIADAACRRVDAAGMAGRIEVRRADAGATDAYVGAVPADLVLLAGIMGNISAADIERLVRTTRSLCAPGAHVIWTRGDQEPDLGPAIRGWFADEGFTKVALHEDVGGAPMRVARVRLDALPRPLEPGRPIFTFTR